ncbi:CrcB family protein [Pseudolysinimonas sp.]|uniref:fluoride efflux transporter FluC n=1 Tax=Pseudolysinimonas sp. TaxID=2680009 RepID=UPI00286C48E6|nr:CrcB family protein [Pseudolysinimonas sp.]
MRTIVAVLAGGALGTGARLLVDLVLPHGGAAFPIGTFLVNLCGSFVLGVLVARVWPVAPEWLRAGLGPGLLGSFTTFSALAVSAVDLSSAGAGVVAAVYVTTSVVGGVTAAALGIRLGAPAAAPPPIGPEE